MSSAYFMVPPWGFSSETNGERLERQLALRFRQTDVRVAADRPRGDPDVAQRRGERQGDRGQPARLDLPLPALVTGEVRLVGDALLDREDAAPPLLARRAPRGDGGHGAPPGPPAARGAGGA